MTPEQQIAAAVKGIAGVRYATRWKDPKIAGFGRTTWTPRFVMLHHTGGTDSYTGLASGAYGDHKPVPGANFLVLRDGSLVVLSKFITYHAGKGSGFGVAANMMNPECWGIEIEDLGRDQTMTAAQISTTAKLAAGLLKAMGRAIVDALIQHKAWSSTGKPDTRYSDAFWRAHVKAALTPAVIIAPVKPKPSPVAQVIAKVKALGSTAADTAHPVMKLSDLQVPEGEWVTFASDHIAATAGVKYGLSIQLRRAPNTRVQTRVVRLGWGAEATAANGGTDATMYNDEAAQAYASSHTYGAHPIVGGGAIAFQVCVHGGRTVPTLVAKVTPIGTVA